MWCPGNLRRYAPLCLSEAPFACGAFQWSEQPNNKPFHHVSHTSNSVRLPLSPLLPKTQQMNEILCTNLRQGHHFYALKYILKRGSFDQSSLTPKEWELYTLSILKKQHKSCHWTFPIRPATSSINTKATKQLWWIAFEGYGLAVMVVQLPK